MERKLTAILYADVAGYSRLTDADEEGTHRIFRAHFDALTGGVEAHGGRVVHTAGDAVLAEFASVVAAVGCAVAAQRDLAARNASLPADRRLEFRIGVNLGDVIVDGEEIYGNGVNVAARLETLAEPGGVCVSGQVREQVDGNLEVGFASLGPRKVKNIEAPVDAYDVLLAPGDGGRRVARKPRRRANSLALAAAVLALAAGAAGWWWNAAPHLEPASMDAMAFPLPPKPSIAVLPFADFGAEPEPGRLADGMTENLIATLTRLPGLFVVARRSVFTYKSKTVPVQRIAEELGVRYLLEGSLQRAGERLRITVRLVDATEGRYLWSERYDRDLGDLFSLQDEIALETAKALKVELTGATPSLLRNRATTDLGAWLDYVNGRASFDKFTKETNARARALYRQAVARDPRFAAAWAGIGWTDWAASRFRWAADWKASMAKAEAMADKAAAIAPDLPDSHLLRGQIHFVRGEFDGAVAEARRALALGPGDAQILAVLGQTLLYAGAYDESVRRTERAMRLNPFFPSWYLLNVGRAKMFEGDYQGAIEAAEQGLARAESPFMAAAHRVTMAMAYAESGDLPKARQTMDRVHESFPKLTVTNYAERYKFKRRADWERFAGALRAAGLPEGGKKTYAPAK